MASNQGNDRWRLDVLLNCREELRIIHDLGGGLSFNDLLGVVRSLSSQWEVDADSQRAHGVLLCEVCLVIPNDRESSGVSAARVVRGIRGNTTVDEKHFLCELLVVLQQYMRGTVSHREVSMRAQELHSEALSYLMELGRGAARRQPALSAPAGAWTASDLSPWQFRQIQRHERLYMETRGAQALHAERSLLFNAHSMRTNVALQHNNVPPAQPLNTASTTRPVRSTSSDATIQQSTVFRNSIEHTTPSQPHPPPAASTSPATSIHAPSPQQPPQTRPLPRPQRQQQQLSQQPPETTLQSQGDRLDQDTLLAVGQVADATPTIEEHRAIVMASLRKVGMDMVVPSQNHDTVLGFVYWALLSGVFQPLGHRELIDMVVAALESDVAPRADVEGASRTKVRGVIALMKHSGIIVLHPHEAGPVQLTLGAELTSFRRLRERHDSFLLHYIDERQMALPTELVRELTWSGTEQDLDHRAQRLERLREPLQQWFVSFAHQYVRVTLTPASGNRL